jgi:1,2-diacylglycerol 3-alpha-glucosyltransferase
MRILITGQTYYPAYNGEATFMVHLAEGLAQRGHDILVAIPAMSNMPPVSQRNGVKIHWVNSIPLNFLHPDTAYSLFPEREITGLLEKFRPQVVHIQDHYPISKAAVKAARRKRVKLIGTNHFMPENLTPYLPLPRLVKPELNRVMWDWMLALYNQLDAVTAPSQTAADILRAQGLHRPVFSISCGIDPAIFKPEKGIDRSAWRRLYGLDPQRTLFLFVGRVDGEKRLDVLLDALHLLKRDDIQLGIVGKGAARDKLATQVQTLGLDKQVHFTGFVPDHDLPSLLNAADIFAMPSEAELLSIATLEAMASGKPILAARANALPELVDEGLNGSLFQPGDAADAARKMTWLADHPERWNEMGQSSLNKVKPHNLENVLQSYEALYHSITSVKTVQPDYTPLRQYRNA